MTEQERKVARRVIDEAKRRALTSAEIRCEWCSCVIEPHPNGSPKRYCCARHRSYAWYRHSEAGRAALLRKNRRARRRKGMPRRVTHERVSA